MAAGPNPHTYQHKCIGDAVSFLMSLVASPEERINFAVGEFVTAYGHDVVPSEGAFEWWNRIQQICGNDWTPERAAQLTERQRMLLTEAFRELDQAITRDYFRHGWREI